jgi:hypothetical protein
LFDRLKARFHRDSACCDTCGSSCSGCSSCGSAAAPAAPATNAAPAGEPLKMPKEGETAPKKLPDGKDKEAAAPRDLNLNPTVSSIDPQTSRRPF